MTVSTAQLANACALWAIVQARQIPLAPDRLALGVICAAFDESSETDLTYGDTGSTSVGFFQQTAGYGTVEARMDPASTVAMFLDGGPQGQRGFLQQPYNAGTLDDLARCIQAVQQSQFDGKTINPKTGKPYPLAGNYIAAMPTAVDLLNQVKALMFSGVIRQLNAAATAAQAASNSLLSATGYLNSAEAAQGAIGRYIGVDLGAKS